MITCILLLLLAPLLVHPQNNTDAQDLQFLQDYLTQQQLEYGWPSAVISFRKDFNSTPLTAVYGSGVNPYTVFRLASISKSFTAVTVMQLVDNGLVKLEDEASIHMPPELANLGWPSDIKIIDLLAHTAGFEQNQPGATCNDGAPCETPLQYLINNKPRQAFPSRSVPCYSNYGIALAGAIVAHKRGFAKWSEYMESQFFPAVGMTNCTFAQLESIPWDRMAPAYDSLNYPSHYWIHLEPAASIVSCGVDMHAYMAFRANNVTPGIAPATGQRILSAQSYDRMFDSGIWPDLGLGLDQVPFGPHSRAFLHTGVLYGWGTTIHFVPSIGLYYFIAVGATGSQTSLLAACALHQRFAPGTLPPLPSLPGQVNLATSGDTFWQCRAPFSGPLLLGEVIKRMSSIDYLVPSTDSNFLLLNYQGTPIPYNLVASEAFQYNTTFSPHNDTNLQFCTFVSVSSVKFNTPEYFTFSGPTVGYLRITGNITVSYALGILFTAVVGVICTTIALLIALLVRRVGPCKDRKDSQDNDVYHLDNDAGKFAKLALIISYIVYAISLLDVIFIVSFFATYATTAPQIDRLSVVLSPAWQFILVCPKVLCFLFVAFGVGVILLLVMRYHLWSRQKELYVISVLHFAFMLMLILGFVNVGSF